MANAFTSTASASLGGTAGGAGLVQTAYDLLFEKALRAATLLSNLADRHPTNQTNPIKIAERGETNFKRGETHPGFLFLS